MDLPVTDEGLTELGDTGIKQGRRWVSLADLQETITGADRDRRRVQPVQPVQPSWIIVWFELLNLGAGLGDRGHPG